MADVEEIAGQAEGARMTASAAGTGLAQAVVEPWGTSECLHSPVGCILPVGDLAVEGSFGLVDSHHQTCAVPAVGSRTARGYSQERRSCPSLQRLQHRQQIVEIVNEGRRKDAGMWAMWAWGWSLSRKIVAPPPEM